MTSGHDRAFVILKAAVAVTLEGVADSSHSRRRRRDRVLRRVKAVQFEQPERRIRRCGRWELARNWQPVTRALIGSYPARRAARQVTASLQRLTLA
jgi:hypothetical protein